jgi:hypothetical protein
VPLHERIDRRERGIAERLLFAGGIEQPQQCGQQRDADEVGDDHAKARDQAELGKPLVVGRQERHEAGGGRCCRERQRNADMTCAIGERLAQIVHLVSLGTIADTELDAEVDADPDEEHGERDRDRIERADEPETDGGSHRQSREDADQDRHDDSRRSQRQP